MILTIEFIETVKKLGGRIENDMVRFDGPISHPAGSLSIPCLDFGYRKDTGVFFKKSLRPTWRSDI